MKVCALVPVKVAEKEVPKGSFIDIPETDLPGFSGKIAYIKERLRLEKSLTFVDLLEGQKSRRQLIYTFLAILELVKMRVIGAYQSAPFAAIRIFLEGEWDTGHE